MKCIENSRSNFSMKATGTSCNEMFSVTVNWKIVIFFFSSTIFRIRLHPLDRIVTFDRHTPNIYTAHRSSINASNPVARVINYAIDLFLVTAAISLSRISNSILRQRWRFILNVNVLHSCTQTMYKMRSSVECRVWENESTTPSVMFGRIFSKCLLWMWTFESVSKNLFSKQII